MVFVLALLVAAALLAPRFPGFGSQRPGPYAALGPAFDPRRNLNGAILFEGVIYGPLGHVSSRFVAQMQGKWHGNRGVLTRTFRLAGNGTIINRSQFHKFGIKVAELVATLRAVAT